MKFFAGQLLVACAMLLLTGCSTLISPTPIPTTVTVEDVEAKINAAMDPEGEYRNATSYYQRLVMSMPGPLWGKVDLMVDIRFEKPNRFRYDYYLDNKLVSSMIYVADTAFVIDHTKPRIMEMDEDYSHKIFALLQLGCPAATYSASFAKVDVHECVIDGEEYYWLRCFFEADNPGFFYDVFVDKAENYVRRVQMRTPKLGEFSAVVRKFSKFGSVTIPDEYSAFLDRTEIVCDVINYKLNAYIPPEIFDLPDFPRESYK